MAKTTNISSRVSSPLICVKLIKFSGTTVLWSQGVNGAGEAPHTLHALQLPEPTPWLPRLSPKSGPKGPIGSALIYWFNQTHEYAHRCPAALGLTDLWQGSAKGSGSGSRDPETDTDAGHICKGCTFFSISDWYVLEFRGHNSRLWYMRLPRSDPISLGSGSGVVFVRRPNDRFGVKNYGWTPTPSWRM